MKVLNLFVAIALSVSTTISTATECRNITEKKNKPSHPTEPTKPTKPIYDVPDKAPTTGLAPSDKYPIGPDSHMTPGAICKQGTKRYAQQITYCERNVSSHDKDVIIGEYDTELGFKIRTMNRTDFKIDHFIPLSIGGSNDAENLWPQHRSVYAYSDRLELLLFQAMEADKIQQMDAIRVIKECKLELTKCSGLEDYVTGLMNH